MESKKVKEEQFPVSIFIRAKFKPIVSTYYKAARFADDIADSNLLSSQEKLAKLSAISSAFQQPDKGEDYELIRNLGYIFIQEDLDSSLYLDLLKAFEQDALFKPLRIWDELINYCRYSAAPVGRFLLALYNENPSTYIPAENLCIILQLINHLRDIKTDLSLLRRCYIPLDLMQKYDVKISDLGLDYTTQDVHKLINEMISRIENMIIDVKILPYLIKNFSLRFNTFVILSLTNSVLKKYKRKDILQTSFQLGFYDWLKGIIAGFVRALFCKSLHKGHNL